jgi:hypothetical protein
VVNAARFAKPFSSRAAEEHRGVGNTTAYQIVVTPGATLGTLGIVTVPAHAEICNEPVFALNSANESNGGLVASWFRRILATHKY